MDILAQLIYFLIEHPLLALLIIGGIVLAIGLCASDSSSGSSYSSGASASSYTSRIDDAGASARSRMDSTSDAYRSNVRNTLKR